MFISYMKDITITQLKGDKTMEWYEVIAAFLLAPVVLPWFLIP